MSSISSARTRINLNNCTLADVKERLIRSARGPSFHAEWQVTISLHLGRVYFCICSSLAYGLQLNAASRPSRMPSFPSSTISSCSLSLHLSRLRYAAANSQSICTWGCQTFDNISAQPKRSDGPTACHTYAGVRDEDKLFTHGLPGAEFTLFSLTRSCTFASGKVCANPYLSFPLRWYLSRGAYSSTHHHGLHAHFFHSALEMCSHVPMRGFTRRAAPRDHAAVD